MGSVLYLDPGTGTPTKIAMKLVLSFVPKRSTVVLDKAFSTKTYRAFLRDNGFNYVISLKSQYEHIVCNYIKAVFTDNKQYLYFQNNESKEIIYGYRGGEYKFFINCSYDQHLDRILNCGESSRTNSREIVAHEENQQ